MSVLTIGSIKQSFWLLLKSDSAGSAARAGLGAAGSSVLTRKQWQQLTPINLPTRPVAVLEFGPSPGKRYDVRNVLPTWWLYDDPQYEWGRLNVLQALIEALYDLDSIAYCYTNYAGGIGDEQLDPSLSLPALAMRYQVRGRF